MYKLVNKVNGLDSQITDAMYSQSGENVRQHYERDGDDPEPAKLVDSEQADADEQKAEAYPIEASEATKKQYEQQEKHDLGFAPEPKVATKSDVEKADDASKEAIDKLDKDQTDGPAGDGKTSDDEKSEDKPVE